MLLVIGTDCIGSCKSNYHMITTTTAPKASAVKLLNQYAPNMTGIVLACMVPILNSYLIGGTPSKMATISKHALNKLAKYALFQAK